ncbi:MAG: hypothetical protein ACR2IE_18130 [Candidatus Sumerlaeaceae bacterium]
MKMRNSWVLVVSTTVLLNCSMAWCEDYKLPDATEMQSYSAETQQFYKAGLAALDRVDYAGAYNQFAKAAQLQPGAVRLNRIAAALALKHGRAAAADKSRDYYETAVVCFRSVLAQPILEESVRREVGNQLKIALDEQANLAQRDVKREALGTMFVTELNREYAPPSPRSGDRTGSVAPPSIPAVGGNPLGVPGLPGQAGASDTPSGPLVPGAGTPAPPPGLPTLPYPGQTPLPSLPGAPVAPAAPGPAPAPGSVPAPPAEV